MQVNPRGMSRKTTLALLVTIVSAGCIWPTVPRATRDLDAARARWASTAPVSYDITVTKSCFCDGRTMIVVVDGGKVSSARYADTGEPVPQAVAQNVITVDSLFAMIEHVLASKEETVDASYDATFGFPVSVSFDPVQPLPDAGSHIYLSNFHPR